MSQKWNLQDIRPAGQPRKERRAAITKKATRPNAPLRSQSTEQIPSIVITNGNKRERRSILWAIVLFIFVVGGAVVLSSTLAKTELTIYPEFRDRNISAEFTAFTQATGTALSYEIMTLDAVSESQVQATGRVQVEEQAAGVIEIRKSTPGAERLRAQTRFRTPDGLVFRIPESVVVPGAVTNNSGELVSGTIQSDVFADEVGSEYNLPAGSSFDVPGFQEGGFTALFNSISATNAAEFTGGFSGDQFQIDDGELSTARQALQIELRDQLLEQIEANKPAGTVAFPGAVAITYTQLPTVEYGSDLVTIKERANLQIPLFSSSDLGAFLAREAVATYDGGPVRIEDPQVLLFNYVSATTSNSVIANQNSLTFTLTGTPRFIWEYDAEKLTADLAGLPKTALRNAIEAYPGIEGAQAHITPFWRRTFPENAEEIAVIEVLRTETE